MPFGKSRSKKAGAKRVTAPQYDPNASYPPTDLDLPPSSKDDIGAPLEHPRDYVVQDEGRSSGAGKTVGTLLAGMAVGGAVAGALAYVNQQNRRVNRAAAPADPTDVKPAPKAGGSVLSKLPKGDPITVSESVDIDVRPALVYAQWRKLENLPQILSHLEVVREETPETSYWQARGPAGSSVSWYATIDADIPATRIAWSSNDGADVPNSGAVSFAPVNAGIGTRLQVDLTYRPPGGKIGQLLVAAFGENPSQQVAEDLADFRDAVEAANRGSRATA